MDDAHPESIFDPPPFVIPAGAVELRVHVMTKGTPGFIEIPRGIEPFECHVLGAGILVRQPTHYAGPHYPGVFATYYPWHAVEAVQWVERA